MNLADANPQPNNQVSATITIDENTLVSQVVAAHPDAAEVLVKEYGFHCVGCFASEFETLGEGAVVHGISDLELQELIERLNSLT